MIFLFSATREREREIRWSHIFVEFHIRVRTSCNQSNDLEQKLLSIIRERRSLPKGLTRVKTRTKNRFDVQNNNMLFTRFTNFCFKFSSDISIAKESRVKSLLPRPSFIAIKNVTLNHRSGRYRLNSLDNKVRCFHLLLLVTITCSILSSKSYCGRAQVDSVCSRSDIYRVQYSSRVRSAQRVNNPV